MSRITNKRIIDKRPIYTTPNSNITSIPNFLIGEEYTGVAIEKLGQTEDIMEKHNIQDLDSLEVIVDYGIKAYKKEQDEKTEELKRLREEYKNNFKKVISSKDIVKRIYEDLTRNIKYINQVYFEIYLCEKYEDKEHQYESKNMYKCYGFDSKDKKLLLLNKRRKVIKELSKDNVVWISTIFVCDKNIKLLITDLDYAELE